MEKPYDYKFEEFKSRLEYCLNANPVLAWNAKQKRYKWTKYGINDVTDDIEKLYNEIGFDGLEDFVAHIFNDPIEKVCDKYGWDYYAWGYGNAYYIRDENGDPVYLDKIFK